MYAIIRAGGKQAKVHEGDVIDIEFVKGTDTLTFVPLLVVGDDGAVISDRDALKKASVVAEIVGEARGPKVDIFKYKNKTGYRRRAGHRQKYTTIQVTKIEAPGAAAAADTSKKKKPAKAAAAPAEPEVTAETVASDEEE